MQIERLTQSIEAKFNKSRLVFWYDSEQSFNDEIVSLTIDKVTVLDMSAASIFETKKRIELDEATARFLLCFPYEEPVAERDRLFNEHVHGLFSKGPRCSANWTRTWRTFIPIGTYMS